MTHTPWRPTQSVWGCAKISVWRNLFASSLLYTIMYVCTFPLFLAFANSSTHNNCNSVMFILILTFCTDYNDYCCAHAAAKSYTVSMALHLKGKRSFMPPFMKIIFTWILFNEEEEEEVIKIRMWAIWLIWTGHNLLVLQLSDWKFAQKYILIICSTIVEIELIEWL